MNKIAQRAIALTLAATVGVSLAVVGVSAAEKAGIQFESAGFSIEKISHPDRGSGEVDGILPFDVLGEEVNRYQSYSWSMADYGDSIYIGTCWNPIAGIGYRNLRDHLRDSFMNSGMDYASAMEKASKIATDLVNLLYGGNLSGGDNSTTGTPCIIRVNKTTNESSLVYIEKEKSAYINWNGYRTARVFDGKLYFVCAGFPTSRLIQVDPDSGTSKVVLQRTSENTTFSSGIRGLNIFNNQLIVSLATDGADPDNLELDPGLPKEMQDAMREIAKKDTRYSDPNWDMEGVRILATSDPSDPNAWQVIANQETFDDLPACWIRDSINGGGIWDIKSYDGALYATMVTGKTDAATGVNTKRGFAMYKGEQDGDNWTWTPIIGDTSKGAKYPFGMGIDAPCAGNIQPYGGYLYIGGYNDPMLDFAAVPDKQDWEPLYNDLKNPVHLYRLDTEGNIEEIVNDGFGAASNQYVWNMAEYNGKLIVGTYDTSTLLSGLTQLTDGTWIEMTPEEFLTRMRYLVDLIKDFIGTDLSARSAGIEQGEAFLNGLEQIENTVQGTAVYSAGSKDLVEQLTSVKETYTKYVRPVLNWIAPSVVKTIDEFFDSQDVWNFAYYFAISSIISQSEKGFDLLISSDGVNFEVVTRDGFGDPYNHGAKGLLATDSGFYVGTSNPFWGTQLWKMTDGSEISLTATSSVYNKDSASADHKDISTSFMADKSVSLDAVSLGDQKLKAGEDYELNGTTVTFLNNYLDTLSAGEHRFDLAFSNGKKLSFSILIMEAEVPTDPVDPTDPVNPTDPVDPADPVVPSDPVDPENSTGPVDVTDATDPTDANVSGTENAVPDTGDSGFIAPLVALLSAAGGVVITTMVRKKHKD